MSERVRLEPLSTWIGDSRPERKSIHALAAPGLWRCVRGTKIHRIRSAIVFIHEGRVSPTWWCGNSGLRAYPYRPECGEGLTPCLECDRRWTKAGRPN